MAFEQLMAEATAKREKKEDHNKQKKEKRSMFGHGGSAEKEGSTASTS